MDSRNFIDAIKEVVRDGAIADTISTLENPVGRKTILETKDVVAWYQSLEEDERQLLLKIVAKSVDLALFGILCVIDGARSIENGPSKGAIELRYVKDEKVTILNLDTSLHELYSAR
jgi:hypothetical protein